MSCLFFFFINKNISTRSLSLFHSRSLSLSFCELPGCKWYYIFNTTRHRASTNVDVAWDDEEAQAAAMAMAMAIRVLPVAHDHVERWQPTAPAASWGQFGAANIAATQRILRMRHVAMLPSCHSSCCQLFAFSFIKTVQVCVRFVATLLRNQWK